MNLFSNLSCIISKKVSSVTIDRKDCLICLVYLIFNAKLIYMWEKIFSKVVWTWNWLTCVCKANMSSSSRPILRPIFCYRLASYYGPFTHNRPQLGFIPSITQLLRKYSLEYVMFHCMHSGQFLAKDYWKS